MKLNPRPALAAALIFPLACSCFADFQYTENSKITGGAAAGAMKFAGVFSKNARQATQGAVSTISLKGNKMRREDSLGMAEIIDLDGKQIIQIDTRKKTYSVMTFAEMKAQMEEARRKAAEQQAKHSKDQQTQVTIVPKIQVSAGSGSKKLLDYTAKEMKVRVDMEMKSTDPKTQGQSANMWVNSDSYIAQVKGYDEMKRFYQRLAKELDWVPGAVFGANPQVAPAMVEYRKTAANLSGMPLLSMVSVGMSGQPGAQQASSDDQKQSSNSNSGGNPITHGIGGIFGKKKKKDDASQDDAANASNSQSPSGSLMDTTIEVTSISTNTVDAALFQIPQGYKQVQAKGAQ
ncbi:MAG TPA: hypothetical protein VFR24_21535 [Candidatus Angelobacter sp.]|nr:hypothetical protein [Candidatus Angelobacter sp.]